MSVEFFPTEHKLATMQYVANVYTRGDDSERWPYGLRDTFIDSSRPNTGPASKKVICTNDILNVDALFDNPIPNKCILQNPIYEDTWDCHDWDNPSYLDIVAYDRHTLYLRYIASFTDFRSLEIKIEINGHTRFVELPAYSGQASHLSITIVDYVRDLPEDSLIPIKISGVNAYRGDSNSNFHTKIYCPRVACRLGTDLQWIDNTGTSADISLYLSDQQSSWNPMDPGGGGGGGSTPDDDTYKTVYYLTQHGGTYDIKAKIGSNGTYYTVSSGGTTKNTGILVSSEAYKINSWYVFSATYSVANDIIVIYSQLKGPASSEGAL